MSVVTALSLMVDGWVDEHRKTCTRVESYTGTVRESRDAADINSHPHVGFSIFWPNDLRAAELIIFQSFSLVCTQYMRTNPIALSALCTLSPPSGLLANRKIVTIVLVR